MAWVFIATSSVPWNAPQANSAAKSVARLPVSPTSGAARHAPTRVICTIRRLPSRGKSHDDAIVAMTEPIGGPARANPSVPSVRPR